MSIGECALISVRHIDIRAPLGALSREVFYKKDNITGKLLVQPRSLAAFFGAC